MKYTTYYTSIERVEYEFDEKDIKEILVKHLTGKTQYASGYKWELDFEEEYENDNDDFPKGWHIKLTRRSEKPLTPEEGNPSEWKIKSHF